MMRYFGLYLVAVLLSLPPIAASAQIAEPAELAAGLCASEHPTDSIEWAAECLVKAIRAGDRAAVKGLTNMYLDFNCMNATCDEPFIWGEEPWDHASPRKSLTNILSSNEDAGILYYGDGPSSRGVIFYPGWDTSSDVEPEFTHDRWLIDYFVCDFGFSTSKGIWVVYPGFCYKETEGPFYEYETQ